MQLKCTVFAHTLYMLNASDRKPSTRPFFCGDWDLKVSTPTRKSLLISFLLFALPSPGQPACIGPNRPRGESSIAHRTE